jgi:hypothetical protein
VGKDLFDLDHEVDLNQVRKNSIESQAPRRRGDAVPVYSIGIAQTE